MKIIEQIKNLLADVEQAYIFGSYARNTQDEYSDLDILIVKKTSKAFFNRFRDFPDLYKLGVPLDLLIYTPDEFEKMKRSHNPLVEYILQNGLKIS